MKKMEYDDEDRNNVYVNEYWNVFCYCQVFDVFVESYLHEFLFLLFLLQLYFSFGYLFTFRILPKHNMIPGAQQI